MPTPTWPHLKPHLDRLDHAALMDLLGDLHALNADNRTFLAARFLATTPEGAGRTLPADRAPGIQSQPRRTRPPTGCGGQGIARFQAALRRSVTDH